MTLKNLYFNLTLENLKRRIWPMALSMVVFFFCLPVASAMTLSNYTNYVHEMGMTEIDYTLLMESVFGKSSIFILIVTCIFSVIFAIQGFGYLFSKSKVDLYHSLPVKREKLFMTTFINGIIIYFIPYMINLLISFIITAFYGGLSMNSVVDGITTLFINLVFYFLLYTTIVLVIMLTGNMVVTLLGSAVFLFYGPICLIILNQYVESYFTSYYYRTGIIGIEAMNRYLSPLFAYIYNFSQRAIIGRAYANSFYGITSPNIPSVTYSLIGALVAGIILFVISVQLYKKRPSEMSGKSMIFSITKPIIKILLMIPLVLGSGLFFQSVSSPYGNGQDGWIVFGVIVGILLSHCLIEIIYEFDLKAVKNNIKISMVPLVLSVLVIGAFRFDIFGYDTYLPKKEEIESVSIDLIGNTNDYFYNMEYFEKNKENQLKYYNREEYIFRHMKLTDMDTVFPLLEATIDCNKRYEKNRVFRVFSEEMGQKIPIKFTLKNGKEVYRNNYITEEFVEEIKKVYNSKEYIEGSHPIYSYSLDELLELPIQWNEGGIESQTETTKEYGDTEKFKTLNITIEEKEKLLKVYMEELYTLEYGDLLADNSIGSIDILVEGKSNWGSNIGTIHNYVVPKFVKTIQLIKDYTTKQ